MRFAAVLRGALESVFSGPRVLPQRARPAGRAPSGRLFERIAAGTVLVAAAALAFIAPAAAQSVAYPNKAVRMIVPFGPGSGTDLMARAAADELRNLLGQSVVVDNHAGANGFIAAEMAARAPADGYTLFVTASTTHATNPFLFRKLPYDPDKDFTPVGGLMEAFYVVLVSRDLPVDSLQDLIAWLKANPKKASYGWGATVSQLAAGALLARTGASAAGVAYRSSPQAVTDLLGGQIHFIVLDVTSALAHIKAGRAKGLAVTSPRRLHALPDVPTMAEAGVPDFAAATWVGVFAPAGTPEPIVQRLNAAIRTLQTKSSVPQRMDTCCSASMLITSPAEFGEYVRKDRALWGERITALGIKPE